MIEIPVLMSKDAMKEIFDYIADKARNGMTFVEIGSFIGGSVCYLGQKLKSQNKLVNITCIDNWEFSNISQSHLGMVGTDNYYSKFLENVAKCELSLQTIVSDSIAAADKFSNQSVDFLFVDGCHEYPYTKQELEIWLPKMKQNSVIAGHDYVEPGVKQAVDEVLSGFETIGLAGEYYIKKIGNGL